MECFIHQSPGRLRVRSAVLKDDEERAQSLSARLSHLQGILGIRINAATGSVIVRFNPAITSASVLINFFARQDILQGVVRVAQRKVTMPTRWRHLKFSPTEKKALFFVGKLLLNFALHKTGAKRTRALLSLIL